jgi:hypothetical protein
LLGEPNNLFSFSSTESRRRNFQQPEGGGTPSVAAARLAFVGAIDGLARSSETLSLHAAEFGVGMMLVFGLMLVSPISAIAADCIVPEGVLGGMSGVAGGRVAALVSALPGADVHELLGAQLPGDDDVGMVPVVLPLIEPRISTGIAGANGGMVLELNGAAVELNIGLAPTGLVVEVGLAETVVVVDVTLITDGEISCVAGEQFTIVPGRVGSFANGGVAKVVAGAPGMVAAEKRLVNGLGPVKGDDTIAPGVVCSPIAVVPTVDICAKQLPQPSESIAVIQNKARISNLLRNSSRVGRLGPRRNFAAIGEIHHWVENDQVSRVEAFSNLHLLAEIARE